LTLSAQAPAQTPAPSPNTPPRPTTSATAAQTLTNVTLVGCLYRESAIPGRKPNVAEKAGVLEDYVLAGAMPGGASKNTTLSTGNMYKVEDIADEKLRSMVGKRVEVTGKIDPEGSDAPGRAPRGATADKNPVSPDDINLPEFEATSIKESSGTCPATPPARQ
jgi:hypothetical protein